MNFTVSNLAQIGSAINKKIVSFYEETQRKLHLEIEPGTQVAALSGVLLTTVQDINRTGEDGNTFLKLDAGMTEILRPTMYDARHPFKVISKDKIEDRKNLNYSIVGHCCESGDLLTLRDANDQLIPVELPETQINDLLLVGGAGAYCSSMSAKNYNSFPEAPEVLIRENLDLVLIRRKQTVKQIIQNEISL